MNSKDERCNLRNVAGVFLPPPGHPVATDDLTDIYSNLPFKKVADATMEVRDKLHGKVFLNFF
jgi:hypothetical protein